MTDTKAATTKDETIQGMFDVGAHFAYSKSRRHPTTTPYIFGAKEGVEIFDLEKTKELLNEALSFVAELAKNRKTILFVAGKNEAREVVRNAALSLDMPFVTKRWIGGTLTNFDEIKKRIERFETLTEEKEKGELAKKYTKREQLLLSREIESLEDAFGGLVAMKELPGALFIVDTRRESIAVEEAQKLGIPVISLMNSDCDTSTATYPILANDASVKSISFFVGKVAEMYKKNLQAVKKAA